MFEEEVTPHRAKKDRKRWCKGKVGREHEWEWVVPQNAYFGCREVGPYFLRGGEKRGPWWQCNHQWVCKKCGKQQWPYKNRQDCSDRPAHLEMMKSWWWK